VYAEWVIEEIKKDPKAFEDFGKGKGIIATRERFLKWTEETEEGRSAMAKAKGRDSAVEKVLDERAEVKKYDKTIVVPVGIPGCGTYFVLIPIQNTTHISGQEKQALPLHLHISLGLVTLKAMMCMPKSLLPYLSEMSWSCWKPMMLLLPTSRFRLVPILLYTY